MTILFDAQLTLELLLFKAAAPYALIKFWISAFLPTDSQSWQSLHAITQIIRGNTMEFHSNDTNWQSFWFKTYLLIASCEGGPLELISSCLYIFENQWSS